MAMKMRQSLAELEQEFRQEMQLESSRSQMLWRHANSRTRKRSRERRRKRSSMRFWLLVLSLIATALGVTVAMFATLNALLA